MLTGIDSELVGTWKGSVQNTFDSAGATFVFRADGRFTMTISGGGVTASNGGDYGTNAGQSPRSLDMLVTETSLGIPPTGLVARCLYEIDGDTLRMGHNPAGEPRPQFIETAAQRFTLTRQPDKTLDPAVEDDVASDADAALAGTESLIGLGD